MPRRIFFSFHYEDVKAFRANVVRNNWVTPKRGRTSTPFFDGSIWESSRTKGQKALKDLIKSGMMNTSTTVVLIGPNTHERSWVKYELVNSFCRGNGILGVHINRIRDREGKICGKGSNPLDRIALRVDSSGKRIQFLTKENRKWKPFDLLPSIGNRKKNTIHFPKADYILWEQNNPLWGEIIPFSKLFPTYCWVKDYGKQNFSKWIEKSVIKSRTGIQSL